MLKLIRSGIFSQGQLRKTLQELSVKCQIYGNGCIKWGKPEKRRYYLELLERMETAK